METANLLASSGSDVDFMIHGVFSYEMFGQTFWITTTHVAILIVMLLILAFAIAARIAISHAGDYIGSIFIFIFISNISGLFGLRPPTADYGVTLPLGLITFGIIQYNNIKYNKVGAFTGLFQPLPFLFPINLIGEIAVPFSLSLRLFGNVLSGTVMMSLIYSLLSRIAIGWTGFLHIYFDVFSGAIQTYVFCMLTMVFVSDKLPGTD